MFKRQNKRTYCADGASLSIQASETHYCTPRSDEGPYTHVEVGFILNAIPSSEWEEYADGEFPADVYGYVPIELVDAFIKEHGGIVLHVE